MTTENLETFQDLKNFSEEDAASIKPEICQNAIQCFHERLQTCIDNGDSSVKKYLFTYCLIFQIKKIFLII